MAEHQTDFAFDADGEPRPVTPPSELRDEIAHTWGLPLGERVNVIFRAGPLDAITGNLEILSTPAFPWNSREPLQLRIAGFVFSSRDIESWTR